MLLEAGAQIDPTDGQGNTPLHLACSNGHMETATLLLMVKWEGHLQWVELVGRASMVGLAYETTLLYTIPQNGPLMVKWVGLVGRASMVGV